VFSAKARQCAPEGGTGVNYALNNQRIRVFLIILIIFSLLAFSLNAFASQAQAGLTFTLSVEPASLTAPGSVTVSARVSNAGTENIVTPLSLYDPDGRPVTSFGDGGTLLSLASGDTYPWQGQYAVKQAQLDEGKLVYSLRYSTQSETGILIEQTLPASADIKFTGEKVDLKVSRTITPEVVRRGSEVKVLYELINQGNVELTNIQVKENRLISTRSQSIASLKPGESEQVTFTKSNVTGSLTSSALITYRLVGDRGTRELTVKSVNVPLAAPSLTYTLTSNKTQVSIGEKVMLTLEIKNAGNISYSNITVTDPILGEVFTNIAIDAGQSRTLQKEVTVNATATYAFTLKLADNTGTTQNEVVPPLKVSAYTEGQMLRLNLTLTSDSESISSLPGDIRFNLVVTNDSNTKASNIIIRHAALDIYTINELAPGQSTVVTRDFRLSQAGKYQFTAEATDVQNNRVSFQSNPLNISYLAPTPAPTREIITTIAPVVTISPLPADYAPEGGQLRSALFILALAIGALFALSLVLLLVSALLRARSRAKSNAAYDTFEVSGTRDYNSPADEQKQPLETLREGGEPAAASPAKQPIEMPHEKYLKPAPPVVQPDAVKAEEDDSPLQASDEDGAYRLVRDEGTSPEKDDAEQALSHRGRRRGNKPDDNNA
jgi:uncharacterized repeat protein (TIGR01451 family)